MDKLKNDDEIAFTILQQVLFYGLWLLLGIVATSVITGLALAAFVTYVRDSLYSIFAGNLGNLILNLIAFAFSIGLGILAFVVAVIGIWMPYDLYSNDDHTKIMQQFRRNVMNRIYHKDIDFNHD